MSDNFKLQWDLAGEHWMETGVDRGVLYPIKADGSYDNGEAWNGLRSFEEAPEGADPQDFWADNIKYASMLSAEQYKYNVGCYTYPPSWAKCNGLASPVPGLKLGQQTRKGFGFTCRTKMVNDTVSEEDDAYIIHIAYNSLATPSQKNYETQSDSPSPIELSYSCSSTPVQCAGHKPVSSVEIDSRFIDAAKLAQLEATLYGTNGEEAVETTYKAAPETFDSSLRYFTRSGEGTELSPYVYTEVTISEYETGVDYFVIDVEGHAAIPATEPTLPTPDQLIALLS